jgi:DNA-binding NtrC family response regulator
MHIENVLKETDGNRAVAAKMLGLSRSSLYRKLDSLGISRNDGRNDHGADEHTSSQV